MGGGSKKVFIGRRPLVRLSEARDACTQDPFGKGRIKPFFLIGKVRSELLFHLLLA